MLNHFIVWASRYQNFVDCCCNVNMDDPPVPGAPGNSKCGRQLKVNLGARQLGTKSWTKMADQTIMIGCIHLLMKTNIFNFGVI